MEFLPLIGGFGIATALLVYGLRRERRVMRRMQQALARAAEKRDAMVIRPPNAKLLGAYEVSYGPATIEVSGSGLNRDGYNIHVSVKATLAYGEFPPFELRARPTVSRAPSLGVDPYFDHILKVKCDDPDKVRALWTKRAASLMVALANPRLCREGILPAIDAYLKVTRRELVYTHMLFKHEQTYDMLFELIEELVDAATWAERSRPSPVA